MTNNPPSNFAEQTNNTSDILNLIVKEGLTISKRASNVIMNNFISIHDFLVCTYVDFLTLKKSNKHTAKELLQISNRLLVRKLLKIFPISKRGTRVILGKDISIDDLLNLTERDIIDNRDCGKSTAAEIRNWANTIQNEHYTKIKLINKFFPITPKSFSTNTYDEGIAEILIKSGCKIDYESISALYTRLTKLFLPEHLQETMEVVVNVKDFFTYKKYLLQNNKLNSEESNLLCFFEDVLISTIIIYICNPNNSNIVSDVILKKLNELKCNYYSSFVLLNSESKILAYRYVFKQDPLFFFIEELIKESLSPREYDVICKSWGIGADHAISLEEIGDELNLTRENVRHIYKKAIEKLSANINNSEYFDIFDNYGFSKLDYLTPENTNFYDIKQREYLHNGFNTFCYIVVKLFYSTIFDLYKLTKITANSVQDKIYVCSVKLSKQYDINKTLNYIKSNFNDPSIREIQLNPIILKKAFWLYKDIDNHTLDVIKQFLAYICNDYFDLNVTDLNVSCDPDETITHIQQVKHLIVNVLKTLNNPASIIDIQKADKRLINLPLHKIKTALYDKSLFIPVGRKSIYQLVESKQISGSVTKCIDYILEDSKQPIQLNDLIRQVLEFRPDSNEKSVRSVVLNKIKKHELVVYEGMLIGLISRIGEYSTEYKVNTTFGRMTFDERLSAIYEFIKEHDRLPLLKDSDFERSLYVWYMRVSKSTNLTNEQLVLIYQFDNYIKMNHIPTNADEVNFIENCNSIKRFVLHRGCLPSRLEDEKLSMWLYRIKIKQDSLSDLCKWYLHDLDNYLSAFGISIL